MEERIEYAGRLTGRRGKVFVGGYIEPAIADRLRKAADLRQCTMVELIEFLGASVTVALAPQECACCHE